jgi:glutamate-1-semialdehyde 2,1-aminomutase
VVKLIWKQEDMDNQQFNKSAALLARAKNAIAGGVNSGIRLMETPVPLYHTHGKGSHLWDEDGNEYIDFQIGQGALILGHAHPAITEAISAQAARGTHWAAQSRLEIEAAELLQEHVPVCELVRFSNSATEILIAVTRLARTHTSKWKILRFEGHYHGWNDEGLFGVVPPPDTWDTGECGTPPRHLSEGIIPELAGYHLLAQWNNLASVEAHFQRHGDEISAILCEPILCNNGCIEPESGFLAGLRDIADRYGAVLVFDETITGFRFGLPGAEGWSGVQPDIGVLGKALGGGVPVAALGARREIMQHIIDGRAIHAGTLNGNPLMMAAVKATLTTLAADEGYVGRLRKLGQRLMSGLTELGKEAGLPIVAAGPGAVFQILMSEAPAPRNYRDYASNNDRDLWFKLREALLRKGVRPTCRGIWFITCAHTEEDIDRTLEIAAEAVRTV